ncbi:MAG TPA: hypothetical protein VMU24_10085 [Candidatus Acidoferrales bacterium]|nr:hypothetical protein [Candidatus Acidoferrales bacterium]
MMATPRVLPPESALPYFVLDVETMNPSPDAMATLEAQFLAEWEPGGNLKDPAKIAAKSDADLQRFRERAALLDDAPVAMVGLMFEDATFLLHGLKRAKARWLGNRKNNVTLEGFDGERSLMEAVCTVLNEKAQPDSICIGHNIFGFDLRRLRLACVRNGVKLPDVLRVVFDEKPQRFLDTMQHYCRFFGRRDEIMISQEHMLEQLGIEPLLRGVASGADVPKLLEDGKFNEVATKLLADLVGVRAAFLRMTAR